MRWNNEKCGVSADLLAWERKQSMMLDEYENLKDRWEKDLKSVKNVLSYLKDSEFNDEITKAEILDFLGV